MHSHFVLFYIHQYQTIPVQGLCILLLLVSVLVNCHKQTLPFYIAQK